MGTIGFENIEVNCIIGELPEERVQEQVIFVDLKVQCDFSLCTATDLLQDTINYVLLADLCREVAIQGRYRLLESYASAVLKKIAATFRIDKSWIKVRKPHALGKGSFSFVELHHPSGAASG